jgi:hypothetical protein
MQDRISPEYVRDRGEKLHHSTAWISVLPWVDIRFWGQDRRGGS